MAEIKHFVVIGLGSFGTALANRLCANKCRVTGLDSRKEQVVVLKDVLYEAVIGDATDPDSLRHLPLAQSSGVFISLGEDITPSLLATLHAKELGAKRIIVKGVTDEHGKILQKLGVERVVFPEVEMAEQLADRMTWPNILDFLPIDPEYGFVELAAPDSLAGKTLQETNLRRRFGVWVVGVKDAMSGRLEMFPDANFTLSADQILLLVGRRKDLSLFRELA
jgi:trk system potassium uptake protein TrkA